MAIPQKKATFGIVQKPIYKPITTQSEAISAQQTALSQVVPNSDTEAAAVKIQNDLLNNFREVTNQQAVVTSSANISSKLQTITPSAYINTAVIQADREAQIKALATYANREKIVTAIKYGVDMWRLQAHFNNLSIMGQIAMGNPGCLIGPSLMPWILQAPGIVNATGYFKTLVTSIADAVANQFKQWQDFVTVPGLPWYPMFVAVAAPFAPPTPNIPMNLSVCVSQNQNKLISPTQIENAIKVKLPREFLISELDTFYYPLAANIANNFATWLFSQQIMMVMGMGPVPTFNPPYAPVGPVVNGYIIPSPGHLAV
jgi:hypothetical protein